MIIILQTVVRINLKMIQMKLFTKQKHTHRLQKQTYSYQKGNVGGRDRLAVWD